MISTRSNRIAAALAAILAFALFLALGFAVSRNGEPAALLLWEQGLLDHSTLLAWWLTWACYVPVLLPVAVVLLILAWRLPAWRTRILFSIVMLLICWRGADLFQHFFARPRRLDWVVKHESAFSYPSSHAAIVTGFYLLWAWMLFASGPATATKRVAGLLLVLFAIAVCWSRLALGAHYVTDLIGGVLLAVALVKGAWAAVPVNLDGPVAGRLRGPAE
jgi:undecaprenyl-diphosphatase